MARRPGGEAALLARLESAPGLTRAAGHRYAGLLEGESHLGLVRNNRTGWRCHFAVSLREDDRQTLVELNDALGIGQLSERPARRGSRPQVVWMLSSKLECVALVRVLDEYRFRGRKLAEYEIWREAVAIWGERRYGLKRDESLRMQRLAHQLDRTRAYSDPSDSSPRPSLTDPYATNFLAGFFSGEGSFGLAGRAARFVIKLRRDDRPLLDAFCRDLGLGTVCDVETPAPWSPAAVWHVTGAQDVLNGIALFEAGVLLGRKKRQFAAWRSGAEAGAYARIARAPVAADVIAASRAALAAATAYVAPAEPLVADYGYSTARTAYIGVLRAWAASAPGLLTCTAYEAARRSHRHWPKRNTIAFAFGGWYEALRSAGLEDRAARRPAA